MDNCWQKSGRGGFDGSLAALRSPKQREEAANGGGEGGGEEREREGESVEAAVRVSLFTLCVVCL